MENWKLKLLVFYKYSLPFAGMYYFIDGWHTVEGLGSFIVNMVVSSVLAFLWPVVSLVTMFH